MAVIAVQLIGALNRSDLETLLAVMDCLGMVEPHPVKISMTGTIEATMAAAAVAEALEELGGE